MLSLSVWRSSTFSVVCDAPRGWNPSALVDVRFGTHFPSSSQLDHLAFIASSAPVQLCHDVRSFANRCTNPLDRNVANVTHGEDTGQARLVGIRPVFAARRLDIGAGADKPRLVEIDAALLQPLCRGLSTEEQEDMADRLGGF